MRCITHNVVMNDVQAVVEFTSGGVSLYKLIGTVAVCPTDSQKVWSGNGQQITPALIGQAAYNAIVATATIAN